MSLFREAPLIDGTPGPVSFKRFMGILFAFTAIIIGIIGSLNDNKITIWLSISFISAAIILAICTTVADIVSIINAAKELK